MPRSGKAKTGPRPICPECGSVDVFVGKYTGRCNNCRHYARKARFHEGGPKTAHRHENTKWRDPVALSMDGYDE